MIRQLGDRSKITGLAIAGARMLIGLLWLGSLRWKLPPDFDGGTERGLQEWLQLEVAHPTLGWYGNLITNVVLPNFTAFAWTIFLAELFTGVSLLIGLWPRLGAAIGLGLSLNLGIGLSSIPGEWIWSYAMLAMWHGLFLVAPLTLCLSHRLTRPRRPSRWAAQQNGKTANDPIPD